MDLKNILKALKMNESTISMLLGVVVVIVVGLVVVNFFKDLGEGDSLLPTGLKSEQTELPTTHTVADGETLWSISEKYYDSGYNWIEIQRANNIVNPGDIEVGQELTIPDISQALAEATPEATAEATETPESTTEPTEAPTPEPEPEPSDAESGQPEAPLVATLNTITGDSYTVVHGDNLWDIAVRAYGDGYQWVKIAQANDLVNPSIIHAGNVFSIPR